MTIQAFATARNIKYLFHFTQVGNLSSILAHGLLPKSHIAANGINALTNDLYRLDFTDGLCLSVSFPNYKMFYPLRQNSPEKQWVVLVINANVLWELDCAFCRENAAKSSVTSIPLAQRRGLRALQAMFEDYNGPRNEQNIPENYPSHPQAEVLVFDRISPEHILAAIFDDVGLKALHSAMNLPFGIIYNHSYFSARQDFNHWKANG